MSRRTYVRREPQKQADLLEYKTVGDLNRAVKGTLEPAYSNVKVSGEISNLKVSNGNLFATLKDPDSSINLSCWGYGQRRPAVNLTNGDRITVRGKVTHYGKTGNISLQATTFEKVGTGDLHLEYEELKRKYEELGYFSNKKPLPERVDRIGIVTSLEGAALQDMLYVLKKNHYTGQVVVCGAVVQGRDAPLSIVEGIDALCQWISPLGHRLDCLVVARGGGSFEDLLGFSSGQVVEALHNCPLFTISAVGHEVDFMLSDFVADLRAPTPSISAERICEVQRSQMEQYRELGSLVTGMRDTILTTLRDFKTRLRHMKPVDQQVLHHAHDATELEMVRRQMAGTLGTGLLHLKNRVERLVSQLQTHDLRAMVEKGFVVVTKNQRIVDSTREMKVGQKLKLRMRDGEVTVTVDAVTENVGKET